MKIIVPSYNRAELCITHKIVNCTVVVPNSQLPAYLAQGIPAIGIDDRLDGNIAKKRNAILSMYRGEDICMLDDDIVYFQQFGSTEKITKESEILNIINFVFSNMRKMGARIGGITPTNNHYFLRNCISKKGFIIGSFMCFDKKFDGKFDENCRAKEDYEIVLSEMSKGRPVCKANQFLHNKKAYLGKGGVAEQRLKINDQGKNIDAEACDYLMKRYAQFIRLNRKRPGEISFK